MIVLRTSPEQASLIGSRVTVDDGDVVAVITALCLRHNGWSAEVSWWTGGELREAWVTTDRLKEAK